MCGIGQMFDTHLSRTQVGHHSEGLRKDVFLLISPKGARGVLVEGGKAARTSEARINTRPAFCGGEVGRRQHSNGVGAHSKKRAMM